MKLAFPVMGTSYTVNSYRVGDTERLGLCDMDLQSKCCQAHHFFFTLKAILFLIYRMNGRKLETHQPSLPEKH